MGSYTSVPYGMPLPSDEASFVNSGSIEVVSNFVNGSLELLSDFQFQVLIKLGVEWIVYSIY